MKTMSRPGPTHIAPSEPGLSSTSETKNKKETSSKNAKKKKKYAE